MCTLSKSLETSEANRVLDRPCIDCNWACIGSRKELGMQVQSWWQSGSFSLPRRERNRLPHATPMWCVQGSERRRLKIARKGGRQWRERNLEVTLRKKYWLMSQFCPDHPWKQLQWYPPIKFLQELAFTQGFPSHSFASVKVGRRRTHSPSKGTNQRKRQGDRKVPRNLIFEAPVTKNERTGSSSDNVCHFLLYY